MPRKDKDSISRKRGKDKSKDRYNKFGKYTSKNIRCQEQQKTNNQSTPGHTDKKVNEK
tara:strand:- start:675 stop:848 length:174 start_codon:yes stop_codon:yes gene_type:complete